MTPSNAIHPSRSPVPVPPPPRSQPEIMARWRGDPGRPRVTVLCHTFNHGDYISDALNGFLMQETDFPFEIIVHDDASTDGTAAIIARYCERYPDIIRPLYQSVNQYSRGNRPPRFTFPRAEGKYFALCEGDDYWVDPLKLQRQTTALDEHPDVDLAVHPAIEYDVRRQSAVENYRHGALADVLPVARVIEASDQFAPTASYFMRATACLSMPEWFFSARDLPFGDYFLEVCVGRKGILYLPRCASVYRRNVPGSHTQRSRRLTETALLERLDTIIYYTCKLYEIPDLPYASLDKRLKNVHRDYLVPSLGAKFFHLYRKAASGMHFTNGVEAFVIRSAARRQVFFHALALAFNARFAIKHVIRKPG